jgi:hypothetical protein
MNPDLIAFVWPASRFDDARKALEQESGALHIGLEALATEMSYADFSPYSRIRLYYRPTERK